MTKVDLHEAPAAELTPETARNLDEVLDLYGGDFLDGFYLPERLGFEEWSLVIRSPS